MADDQRVSQSPSPIWSVHAAPRPPLVERMMYASLSLVTGSVFDELARIRAHAIQRNEPDEIHVALLYQSGQFVEWAEGPPPALRQLLKRVARDPRHRNLRMLHLSQGERLLPQPWAMAVVKTEERRADFARRVHVLRDEFVAGHAAEPATIWRRLSTPTSHAGAGDVSGDSRFQRVLALSAAGTSAFELVRWLAEVAQQDVVHRRFGGAASHLLDVATDYADFECGGYARRLIAMARNGLELGLTQAFLRDYSHVVLVLNADPTRHLAVLARVMAACEWVGHRPKIVALGPSTAEHAALAHLVAARGFTYEGRWLSAGAAAQQGWPDVEAVLDADMHVLHGAHEDFGFQRTAA